MDIHEAELKRAELSARFRQGQITMDGYTAALSALRVTDNSGRVWQPDPGGTGWLVWNGSAWQPGTPPLTGYAGSPPPIQTLKRPQKWWDLLSILGGIAGVVIWFLYSGTRGSSEGLALITPLLMIAIPIILVVFRPTIDQVLQPLQPYRKKVSKILLIALGIATPFLTAWILGTVFHIGLFPLMQVNMIIGTFAAYIITRDPSPVPGKQNSHKPVAGQAMIIFTILFCSLIVVPVLAAGPSCDLNGRWDVGGRADLSDTITEGSETITVPLISNGQWKEYWTIVQSGNSVVISNVTYKISNYNNAVTTFKFTMSGKTATKEFTTPVSESDSIAQTSGVQKNKQILTVSDDCNSFTLEDSFVSDETVVQSGVVGGVNYHHIIWNAVFKGTRLSGGTAPGTPAPKTPASKTTVPVTPAPVTPESVTDTIVSAGIIATVFSGLVNAPIIIQSIIEGAAGAGTAGAAAGAAGAGVEPPAPPGGPYVGDKGKYIDPYGIEHDTTLQADGTWLTDEGHAVNLDRADSARQEFERGRELSRADQAKQIAADTAKAEADRQQLEAIRVQRDEAIERAKEKVTTMIAEQRDRDREFADMYKRHSDGFTTLINRTENAIAVADFSVNVLEKMTGSAGSMIKKGYVITKDLGKNMSESLHKGESLLKGVARGGLEAGFDVGFDALKKKLPSGPGNWNFEGSKTDLVKGFTDGLKSSTQSLVVKKIVKDPIKDLMKKGSDKLLGNTLGTYK